MVPVPSFSYLQSTVTDTIVLLTSFLKQNFNLNLFYLFVFFNRIILFVFYWGFLFLLPTHRKNFPMLSLSGLCTKNEGTGSLCTDSCAKIMYS